MTDPRIVRDLRDYYKGSQGYRVHLAAKNEEYFRKFVAVVCSLTAQDDAILDLGCGTGQSTRYIYQRRKNVVGVDLSPCFLEGAGGNSVAGPKFAAGDAAQLPFANNRFDLVCSMEFIEHIWPVEPVLREMIRIVRQGGKIVISSPTLLSPLRPLFDLPGMLSKKAFRPPLYDNFADAGKYFVEALNQSTQKYFSRTPQFLYREPDVKQADGGGDFDAVYKAHPSDLETFFRNAGLSVRFATGPSISKKEWLKMHVGAALSSVWTSFTLIATRT